MAVLCAAVTIRGEPIYPLSALNPSHCGNLSGLQSIDISNNSFQGFLDPYWYYPELVYLDISGTVALGDIPSGKGLHQCNISICKVVEHDNERKLIVLLHVPVFVMHLIILCLCRVGRTQCTWAAVHAHGSDFSGQLHSNLWYIKGHSGCYALASVPGREFHQCQPHTAKR